MVDNIVTKPLGLVLIVTAHMVFNGPSQGQVTGILGQNVTLEFRFNDTVIHHNSNVAIYINGMKKIAECLKTSVCSGRGSISRQNTYVVYNISKLTVSDSDIYWASLFRDSGLKESDKVHLIVREENRTTTVPPAPTNATIIESTGSSFSFRIVTVLVVSPVVLLAAVLPLIWCLVRTKDKKQQPSPQNCNPTVQETVEESNRVPPPSLVYSVLDFPKRPPAVLEMNPSDTEYAAVSYLAEKRWM
ncbi:uncharacterized protein LOC108881154 [Lates calcarifer]|uniref:Uncharacterized protein LOC108881154 n=1 Tax=Lates calcarifer TaxID=8187 RepID=A0AAJ7LQ46_LATCA|nr:uncharacterized protein LOC108881154 [Lates calcarifer]